MKRQNIILIGYMGCGKSTVGRKLSYIRMNPYVDTDKLIERSEGSSINEIFDTKGEAYFRQAETDCIKSLFAYKQPHIVAVGGGLVLREENRSLLNELGTVVYLKAAPQTIYERLKEDTTRPLLRGDNPYQRICDMLSQREPVYEMACDVTIEVDSLSAEQVAQRIMEVVK